MAIYLPVPKEIRDLFTDLMGREVTLSPSSPLAPRPAEPTSVAVYVDDHLQVSALVVCDLAFSAYAGAAIGLIPAPIAAESIEAGALDDNLRDNLYEVLNIASSLFNPPGADHLKLYELFPAAVGGLPPQVRIQTLTLGRREDLSIDIAGYGHGLMSIVLTL